MNDSQVVVVVDDDQAVRVVVHAIATSLGYEVESYESGGLFLENHDALDARDRCLILDYQLPEMNGLSVIQEMMDHSISVPVVLMTGNLDSNVAVTAMRGGAINCIEKPISRGRFAAILEDAFESVASVRKMYEAREHNARFGQLSEQEKEIVRLAADGLPNKRIAVRLGISIKTVEKHRRRAYETLHVDSTALMARAVTLQSMHNMMHPCRDDSKSLSGDSLV